MRQGHLLADAARIAGVDRSTVRRACRRAGIEPRQAVCGMHLRAARDSGMLPQSFPAPPARSSRSAAVEKGLSLVRSESLSVSEAARRAGCSRTALSRALADQ